MNGPSIHWLFGLWLFAWAWPTAQVHPQEQCVERSADARAYAKPTGTFAQLELHFSALNDAPERSFLNGAFGWGLRGGYRYRGWGAFAFLEHDLWLASEMGMNVVNGVFNYGGGVDVIHGGGYVRTVLAFGLSTLVYDTALDKSGTTGVFFDLHPLGLRYAIHERVLLGFDPLTFTVVAPQLAGIPLIRIEYRTALYAEAVF